MLLLYTPPSNPQRRFFEIVYFVILRPDEIGAKDLGSSPPSERQKVPVNSASGSNDGEYIDSYERAQRLSLAKMA